MNDNKNNPMSMVWWEELLKAINKNDMEFVRTVLDDNVWMYTVNNRTSVWHVCSQDKHGTRMILRDNEAGPVYWCRNCGYITTPGVSMAIRLNEVPL